MDLSPEERQKIYEEEKKRIETEQEEKKAFVSSDTGMESNVAGLLCYVGLWVTGIIFLVIEKKDPFVRFHALQSIIVFGVLTVICIALSNIPFIGGVLGALIGILIFILWIVLMIKAYQGEQYIIPIAGDIAAKSFPKSTGESVADVEKREDVKKEDKAQAAPKAPVTSKQADDLEHKIDTALKHSRAGRIAASTIAIIWSIALLVFFCFFSSYIAFYQARGDNWTRTPILTGEYFEWLPVLVATLLVTIAGHIILISYDRYWLRQIVHIIINIFSVVAVVSLLIIFPFNFAAGGDMGLASTLSIITTIVLIAIAVGMGIATLVILIKLIVYLVSGPNSDPSRL
jgi:uncharacterized membrane protein